MSVKVLVVAPHPDDEVLGCGGVIARHVALGDTVQILMVSKGIPELYPPEIVDETYREMREAHKVLGLGADATQFLEFPAPMLDSIPGYKLAESIGRVIRQYRAEWVYLPHRGDIHSDHRAVYLATLVASRPTDSCSVRKLLCYETPSETDWAIPSGEDAFVPTLFVDISAYLDRKLQALACYRSQLKAPPHPRSLLHVEALARARGGTVGLHAAETFMLVREVS